VINKSQLTKANHGWNMFASGHHRWCRHHCFVLLAHYSIRSYLVTLSSCSKWHAWLASRCPDRSPSV